MVATTREGREEGGGDGDGVPKAGLLLLLSFSLLSRLVVIPGFDLLLGPGVSVTVVAGTEWLVVKSTGIERV